MNPNHLRAFRAVAESGGFVKASTSLRVSQPAVSAHVRTLEEELGAPLFDRLPRGVALTAQGRLLLDYAKRLEAIEAEARDAIADVTQLRAGRLTVGASTTIGVYMLPQLLGRFRASNPAIGLTATIDNTGVVLARLADGTLDLAITEGEPPEPALGLDTEVFARDELVVITPPGHPLAQGKRVSPRQIASEPFIAREPGSGTSAVVERAFLEAGLERQITLTLGHTEAIKRAVASGLGIAIVSELTIGDEQRAGSLGVIRPKPLDLSRPLHLSVRAGRTPSPTAQAFIGLLREDRPGRS